MVSPNTIAKWITESNSVVVYVFQGARVGDRARAIWGSLDYNNDDPDSSAGLDGTKVAAMFLETVRELSPGAYTVRYMRTPKSQAAMKEVVMNVTAEDGTVHLVHGSSPQPAAIGGLSSIYGVQEIATNMEEKFALKLAEIEKKYEHEREKSALTQQINDLKMKLEAETGIESKLSFLAESLLTGWLQMQGGGPKPALGRVAGFPPANVVPMHPPQPQPPQQEQPVEEQIPVAERIAQIEESVHQSVNTITEKINTDVALLLNKLAALTPEQLSKLANISDHKLNAALSFL